MIETLEFLDKLTLLEVLNAIRKSFTKNSPHYLAVVKLSLTSELGPRGGARYKCAHCKKAYGRTEIQVDHKEPVIPVGISPLHMTLKQVYERCWVELSKLQVLCKLCHQAKSKQENKERRDNKAKLIKTKSTK